MAEQKTISRSSTKTLEKEIEEFYEESGQSKATIYKRAHILYMATERRKIKPGRE